MSRHRSKIQISPTVTTAVNGNNTKLHQTQTILCSHPKHAEYESSLKKTVQSRAGKNLSMIRVPKRMVLALGVREGSLICRRCLVKTDKDPEVKCK
ncbi:hypothetical protein G9A89_006075 [Geosiphon pyriformis]|nr:hypothetical protein G9A89_006075 [Geosiphon pyriformis]